MADREILAECLLFQQTNCTLQKERCSFTIKLDGNKVGSYVYGIFTLPGNYQSQ